MTAEQSLREGKLDVALQELQQLVRKEPAVSKHRVFLFQLQAVLGLWQKARTQLDVLQDLDAKTVAMVRTYREALRCEVLRAEVWKGKRTPLLFGEPQQWAAELVQAGKLLAEGKVAESQALRNKALEAAPAVAGTLTVAEPQHGGGTRKDQEHAFGWIADADTRIGPLLEAVVNGKYYWMPWTAIAKLRLDPPADLRDFVWMPCTIQWTNGGEAVALLPCRYPGSEADADPLVRLGRVTRWRELGHEAFTGLGQKVLATDGGEYSLLDLRQVRLARQSA